jgi:superfamily II DNA or RNA helicase
LFDKFRDGKILIVISTLCKEGIDIPRCSAVVIAHDTQDAQQLVGRIVRLHPGKEKAIVVHLVDEHPIFRKHTKFNERVFYKPQKITMEHITRDDLSRIS